MSISEAVTIMNSVMDEKMQHFDTGATIFERGGFLPYISINK